MYQNIYCVCIYTYAETEAQYTKSRMLYTWVNASFYINICVLYLYVLYVCMFIYIQNIPHVSLMIFYPQFCVESSRNLINLLSNWFNVVVGRVEINLFSRQLVCRCMSVFLVHTQLLFNIHIYINRQLYNRIFIMSIGTHIIHTYIIFYIYI